MLFRSQEVPEPGDVPVFALPVRERDRRRDERGGYGNRGGSGGASRGGYGNRGGSSSGGGRGYGERPRDERTGAGAGAGTGSYSDRPRRDDRGSFAKRDDRGGASRGSYADRNRSTGGSTGTGGERHGRDGYAKRSF